MTGTRVVVLGAGAMGGRHARVLATLRPIFSFQGVYDIDEDAAHSLARACGGMGFRTAGEAIHSADLVVVATPIRTHAPLALLALDAKRHVFVEKPLCASAKEAHSLTGAALRARRSLFVGHSERFNPAVLALARLVSPQAITAIYVRRINGPPRRLEQEGALLNLGVHDFDLIRVLTSSAVKVQSAIGRGNFGSPASGNEQRAWLDDWARVFVRTASGRPGELYVNRIRSERQRTLVVTTADAVWETDLLHPGVVRIARGTGARERIPLPATSPLVLQALAMARALNGVGSSGIAIGEDGLIALRLAENALRLISISMRVARAPNHDGHSVAMSEP